MGAGVTTVVPRMQQEAPRMQLQLSSVAHCGQSTEQACSGHVRAVATRCPCVAAVN